MIEPVQLVRISARSGSVHKRADGGNQRTVAVPGQPASAPNTVTSAAPARSRDRCRSVLARLEVMTKGNLAGRLATIRSSGPWTLQRTWMRIVKALTGSASRSLTRMARGVGRRKFHVVQAPAQNPNSSCRLESRRGYQDACSVTEVRIVWIVRSWRAC